MSREHPQFKLRLPPELRALIDASATANHRSLNSEIVARLQQSFRHDTGSADETPIQRALHAADQAEGAILALRTELSQFERNESK